MHLFAGDIGRVDDGEAAIDLDQSPGDVIVLSAADSELALLAAAAARNPDGPSLRLANLMQLGHPMSVDLYVDKTAARARLVVVRLMGGAGYWPYGIDRLRALARGGGPLLAVVPGDDRWDAGLEANSTVAAADCRRLWRYLAEGGAANAGRALAFMAHLIGRGPAPAEPEALPRSGCYLPGEGAVPLARLAAKLPADRPAAAIIFYRAILQAGSTAPIDALAAALAGEGIAALPFFVASLKDGDSQVFLRDAFAAMPPAIVLNTTAFAVSAMGEMHRATILDAPGRPVLQVILAGSSEAAWRENPRGLMPRDLTMNVVLPEVDGRIGTRAVSFKAERFDSATDSRTTTYRPVADRIGFVARQAAAWVGLAAKPPTDRRIAIILSDYPSRPGRIGHAVGLDTPASAVKLAEALNLAGYDIGAFPETGASLIEDLSRGNGGVDPVLPIETYRDFLRTIPDARRDEITGRWGKPEEDASVSNGGFHLPVRVCGNVAVGVQPSRGYGVDAKATYHDSSLPPTHGYLAFYVWLRRRFMADAVVHLGKHGSLEWLPGKALALSDSCWPEVVLGPTPLIYPFIVNDPGEGAQAKRRSSAVIVDHLMPAMTRAELYGPLAQLETLVDEYYLAAGVDRRRRAHLEREIIATAAACGLDHDLGVDRLEGNETLQALDAYLCELKEMQIRDGLHTFGEPIEGRQRIDTLVAIARVPRGGSAAAASLHRAIATDLSLAGFDPLVCDLAAEWTGLRPALLAAVSDALWRTVGDTVERIEALAARMVERVVGGLDAEGASFEARALPEHLRMATRSASAGADQGGERGHRADQGGERGHRHPEVLREAEPRRTHRTAPESADPYGPDGAAPSATSAVLDWIVGGLAPALDASADAEIAAVLAGLDGRFVAPGPSGSPTRGRPEVLPTGRNFYTVDVRAVPTAAAWALGRAAADGLALRYFQDEGTWPRSVAMSAWSTSNMRTGGDDIAEVLALIGVEPVWEAGTGRVTGFRVMALSEVGRPRIDVTLKISGMFRDAFPEQIDLMASAFQTVAGLEEDETANPIAAGAREARDRGASAIAAATRIFGTRAGGYGAGIAPLIDGRGWRTRNDLAEAFLAAGGFAYGGGRAGAEAGELFARRLANADAVIHNQDNREHDLLDSNDYHEFQGGLAASVEALKGAAPRIYHGDHSRPERPAVRGLAEELSRVVRGRAANPKWIAGMMRHGYRGAQEMAVTVGLLFAYAALTDAVGDHHFDQLYEAYLADVSVREFIAEANPGALADMAARFREAIDRGLWTPRQNSVHHRLVAIIGEPREAAE